MDTQATIGPGSVRLEGHPDQGVLTKLPEELLAKSRDLCGRVESALSGLRGPQPSPTPETGQEHGSVVDTLRHTEAYLQRAQELVSELERLIG